MERCSEHANLTEKVNEIGLSVARTEEIVKNAIKEVSSHISAGSKWRLAIACSCISLVGVVVGGIVRFSVMEYRTIKLEDSQKEMNKQILDLNYEKGKAVGLAEKNAR
jgi:hypothetical protein